jgi:hypothetical protein
MSPDAAQANGSPPAPCTCCGSTCGAPLAPSELERFRERLRSTPPRAALEATLLELDPQRANLWMMLLREGRAAYLPMLSAGGGRLLLCGNALSGAAVALLRAGFEVLLLDRCQQRLSTALVYLRALLGPSIPVSAIACSGPKVPLGNRSVQCAIAESPGAPFGDPQGPAWSELARVAQREVLVLVENRLAYKRSSGLRADFRLLSPGELLGRLCRPEPQERSLWGHRRALRSAGLALERSFALYPHSNDWSHLLALDRARPRLTVGPLERKNRLKLLAQSAGLVPWITPSFAFLATPSAQSPGVPALESLLDRLAAATGEPRPELDVLIATRGNTAVLQTAVPGLPEQDPAGRFTIHLALSPQQELQARRHFLRLKELAARFPNFPIPAPLYEESGALGHAIAERRLPGHTAPQFTGQAKVLGPLYARLALSLAELVVAPARPLDEAEFERLFAQRVDLVARRAGVATTVQALERLIGVPFPRVLYHSDLRAKHVMTDAQGRLLGVLDWGSSEASDLPYFDLLNLILHDRKQAAQRSIAWAWGLVRNAGPAGLDGHERRALEDYAERLSLPRDYCRTIEAIYPLLVSAMAEANWDYSRPRWVHENFEL